MTFKDPDSKVAVLSNKAIPDGALLDDGDGYQVLNWTPTALDTNSSLV